MADKKITELPLSGALDGTEIVPIVQSGVTSQATTQDIADLGGGTQDLQSVTDVGNTTSNNIEFNHGSGIILTNTSKLKDGTIDAGYGGNKGIAQICAVGYELKWESGRLYVMNDGGTTIRETLYNFTTIPTGYDDISKGFIVGSRWILDNGDLYVCTDNSDDIAIWELQKNGIPTLAQVLSSGSNMNATGFFHSEGGGSKIELIDGSIDLLTHDGDSEIYMDSLNMSLTTQQTLSLTATSVTKNGVEIATIHDIPTQVVPTGGTTGQILAKVDNTDYNLEWIENYANYTSVLKHTVKASVALTKGQAVYVSGVSGTNMLVSKASNVSESTSSKTLGLIAQDLAINGQGFVITEGLLTGLNTLGATIGDSVWLGTNGDLIFGLASKPYAPSHLVFIGIVTRVGGTVGEIFVKVQNGFELKEIHDIDLITTAPSNNNVLTYESSTSLWKNKTVVSALGFTPYNSTNPSGYITSSALTPYAPLSNPTFTTAITTPIINGVSGLLSFKTTDNVSVGNYATPSAQRIFTVGQDTAFISMGSLVGSTGFSAIYMNTATPALGNYTLRGSTSDTTINCPSSMYFSRADNIFATFNFGMRSIWNMLANSFGYTPYNFTRNAVTGTTASTALSGWIYTGGSTQWPTGNITTQSEIVWGATTYSFVGASTITNAYGNVFNAPIAGTNATITNRFAALFNQQISLTQTVTTETVAQTRTVTIVINGVTYKLLAA